MEWLEVTVATTSEAAEAVAAEFTALGSGGVVIEDAASPASLRVIAYWPAGPETDARLDALRRFLAGLPRFGLDPGTAAIEVARRDDAEWAENWKRFYHTQRIGQLVIRPSWEEYRPEPGEIVLTLDPGMAFGTGTHPTTALCLAVLAENIAGGEFVVDAGTGSGILALAAAKLGAARVMACDVDPVACRVAEENLARNGVTDRVTVRAGDAGEALRSLDRPADLLVANIVADVIMALGPAFTAATRPGGLLLASGITEERREETAGALAGAGFAVRRARQREGWVLLEAVRAV